jgi:hypothetical protein
MKKSLLMAGAIVLGVGLAAGGARAQAPPAPPVRTPAPAVPPPTAPGTTRPGAAAPAPPIIIPGVRTVMVFPFENNTSAGGRPLGEAIAEAVRRGLEASRAYTAVRFDPNSLLIQRTREENPMLREAITGVIDPTTGAVEQTRAMQIAARTGMQALMLGSIEDYRFNKDTNTVEMVATAQILNAQSGEPLRTAGVTGSATGAAGADESTVAQAAAANVATQILSGLAVPPPPPSIKPPPRRTRDIETQEEGGARRRFPGWIPAAVLLGIVVGTVR